MAVRAARTVAGTKLNHRAIQGDSSREFKTLEGHALFAGFVLVVPVKEGDLTVFDLDEPVIGDGHPVGVSSQVLKNLFGSPKGLFGINNPLLLIQLVTESAKRTRILQFGDRTTKIEFTVIVGLLQRSQEFATE